MLMRPATTGDDYLGVKGGVRLQALTAQGKLADGATVHAGEALRFAVSAPHAGYLLVLGLNERGELFPYYPLGGKASVAQGAAQEAVLPGSAVLDATLGRERFYALLTERPVTVADVDAAVHAARTTLQAPELPVHGEQASVLLEKTAAR